MSDLTATLTDVTAEIGSTRVTKHKRHLVTYQAVATEDPNKKHKERREKQIEAGHWGASIADDVRLQNFIGAVIIINGAVIGLETDLPDLTHWSIVEHSFLAFFICELLFKLGVERCAFFNQEHPDFLWNLFDFFVIGIGVFDVVMANIGSSGTGGFSTIFRMIRLMRILRLFRLLKFLKRLYMLAMGLVEACKAIFWVTILMCFVMYICGIVLVKTLGRAPVSDPHYEFLHERFSTIPQAMITLFVLMSSPNLPIYQDEIGLLEERPYFTIFLIGFITFGSFGMLAMLTGVINESMFENNELRKDEQRIQHEAMRQEFSESCGDLFEDIPSNADGEANIEDVKTLAPQTLELLEQAGAHIAHGDILRFIDNVDVDDSGTINIVEFVQAMEKVAEGVNPLSILAVEKSVGHCTRSLMSVEQTIIKMLNELKENQDANRKLMKYIGQQDLVVEKSQFAMSDHLTVMDTHMQNICGKLDGHETKVQMVISEQIAGMDVHVKNLMSKLEDNHSTMKVVSDLQTQQLQAARYTTGSEPAASPAASPNVSPTIFERAPRRASPEQLYREELPSQVQAFLPTMRETDDSSDIRFQRELSQKLGTMGTSVQKLSSQMENSEQRLQLAVSQQVGEIRRSVHLLLDQKKDGTDMRQPGIQSSVSQQIQDLQKSVNTFMEQTGRLTIAQQLEGTGQSVQKVLDQWRAIGNEASLHGVVSRHVGEMQKQVQKFLDQKDSAESRLQLAVSSQIQDIAIAVQKLLHEKDCREVGRQSGGSDQPQTSSSLAAQQKIEEILESVTALRRQGGGPIEAAGLQPAVSRQMQELSMSVQRQLDSTQTNLLQSVAELGGVLLGGVADLLAKNKLAIQQECSSLLRETMLAQEQVLQKLLGSGCLEAKGNTSSK